MLGLVWSGYTRIEQDRSGYVNLVEFSRFYNRIFQVRPG
jgi:hypothetical protein